MQPRASLARLWAFIAFALFVLVFLRLGTTEDVVDVGGWTAEDVQKEFFETRKGGKWRPFAAAFSGLDGADLAALTKEYFVRGLALTGDAIFNDWRAFVAAAPATVDVGGWMEEDVQKEFFETRKGGKWRPFAAAFSGLDGADLAALTIEGFDLRLALTGEAIFNDWRAFVAAQSMSGVAVATLVQPWLLWSFFALLVASTLFYRRFRSYRDQAALDVRVFDWLDTGNSRAQHFDADVRLSDFLVACRAAVDYHGQEDARAYVVPKEGHSFNWGGRVHIKTQSVLSATLQAMRAGRMAPEVYVFKRRKPGDNESPETGPALAKRVEDDNALEEAVRRALQDRLVLSESSGSRNSSVQREFRDQLLERDGTCVLCAAVRAAETRSSKGVEATAGGGTRASDDAEDDGAAASGASALHWSGNLQAAHVLPHRTKSDVMQTVGLFSANDVRNGVLLCERCHVWFDNYMWSVQDNIVRVERALKEGHEEKAAREYWTARDGKVLESGGKSGESWPPAAVWAVHRKECDQRRDARHDAVRDCPIACKYPVLRATREDAGRL